MLNARHIERGQPDHLDRFANRWATVSPADADPPVDEDALAEARAFERGKSEERANAVALLSQEAAKFERESRAADVDARTFSRLSAKMSVLRTMAAYVARGDRADADRLAAKQGAESS